MVLGLGGTVLPPRPAKRHLPGTAGGSASTAAGAPAQESSLARVHSNSHLAAALAAAGTHTVDTPSAGQQPALPAASGQSNVRGGATWRLHEGHQEVQQQLAQAQRQHEQSASECDQPSPQQPRLQQALQQQAQQQQDARQQHGPAEQLMPPQSCGEGPSLHWQQQGNLQPEQQQLQAQPQQERHLGQDASPIAPEQQQVQQQSAPNQTEPQQSAPEQAQQLDAARPAEQAAEGAAGAGRKRRAEQPPADGPKGSRSRRSRLGAAEAAAFLSGGSAGDAAAAAGGRRGSRRLAAAGGSGATPPTKRQKPAGSAASKGASGVPGGGRAAGGKGRSKFADVLHRVVAVPGAIFYVDTPGTFFFGQVTKSEPKRKVPAVEVLFFDDDSKYWFPVADVRRWMVAMAAAAPSQPNAWERHNPGVPPPLPEQQQAEGQEEVEEEAAKVLQSLSVSVGGSQLTGSRAEPGGQEPAVSSGGKGGRRASGAARGSSRERPASRGGRPGAAAAAGQPLHRTDSQERREGALMAAVQAESR